jgi:hypothetical protein
MRTLLTVCFVATLALLWAPVFAVAQTPPHDPNLPTVRPEALQQLSDHRIQQQIIQESQERFAGRCVCQYMTRDSHGKSCKARHEIIRTKPLPICYPQQVTPHMISDWRRAHP